MSNDSTKSPSKPVTAVRVPWNPIWAVAFAAAVFYISQILGGLLVSIYPLVRHWPMAESRHWLTHSIIAQFSYTLVAEVLVVIGLALFLRFYKVGFRMLGLTRPHTKDVWMCIAGFAGYFVVYGALLGILAAVAPSFNINQKQEIGFDNAHGPVMLGLVFISLAILPPLVEELLMRGFLFGSLRKHLSFIWATLITSVVFASAHLPEGGAAGPLWVAAIDTFILSLVLCYLREKTGRLWAGIGIHAIKNTLAFVTIFIMHVR